MQEFYTSRVFQNEENAALLLSFAGSLLQISIYVISPIAQYLTSQYGVRPVLIGGTILSVLGLELAGFTTKACIKSKANTSHFLILDGFFVDLPSLSNSRNSFWRRMFFLVCGK